MALHVCGDMQIRNGCKITPIIWLVLVGIRNVNMHTCIFISITLMANRGTLVGEGISRAGGTAGRSLFCTVGAGFTMETLWCVGHPWKKPISNLVIINREMELRVEWMFKTISHYLPEMAMFLNITGLTALPRRVYVVALQYSTLLPLFSSTCTNVNMRKEDETFRALLIRKLQQMTTRCFTNLYSNKPCVCSSCSQRSWSTGSESL